MDIGGIIILLCALRFRWLEGWWVWLVPVWDKTHSKKGAHFPQDALCFVSGHDKRFKCQAFFLIDAKQPWKAVLLHYLGDESIVIDFHMVMPKAIKCFIAHALQCWVIWLPFMTILTLFTRMLYPVYSGCPAEYQPSFMPRIGNSRQIKTFRTGFVRKLDSHKMPSTTFMNWPMTLMALWRQLQLTWTLLSFVATTESSLSLTQYFTCFLIVRSCYHMTRPFSWVNFTFLHFFLTRAVF